MNLQNRKRARLKGQGLIWTVCFLGAVVAGALAYSLTGVNRLEAIVLPAIVMGLTTFATSVYARGRRKEEWFTAWDRYAQQALPPEPSKVLRDPEILSGAGTN